MNVLTADLLASFDASVTDVADAITLPPVIYTEPDFLEFERAALFAHEWLCVGVASSLSLPGDYRSNACNAAHPCCVPKTMYSLTTSMPMTWHRLRFTHYFVHAPGVSIMPAIIANCVWGIILRG